MRDRPLRVLWISAAVAAASWAACGSASAQDCPAPTEAEAQAIAQAYVDALNSTDAAALGALLADDYRHVGAVVESQDRALHLDRLDAVRTGFPDRAYTIKWMIVDGDTVAVRSILSGTHQGEFEGVPASGAPVSVGTFHVHRIACGKIAETWNAGDGLGLFRQMGALPGPATTPGDQEAAGSSAAAGADCPVTTAEENTALARRWYDDALNPRQFEVLDEILAEDNVHHGAMFEDRVGPAATAEALRAITAGFPEVQFAVDAVLADDDMVLIRWSAAAAQDGEIYGVPPTGRTVDMNGINAFRIACGRIAESWSEVNSLGILRQIGALE